MTIQIREATEADYPAIATIITAANQSDPVSPEVLKASAEKTRNHPKGLHLAQWVAEKGDEIVGFAGVAQWAGSHHPDRYNVMLVVPTLQGQRGIGSALAATVENHLSSRGAKEVLAAARENEPHAVAFLEKRGFSELEREFSNVLNLDDLPSMQPERPDGYRLLSLSAFMQERGEAEALEAFRTTFNEARADEPRQIPAQPYTTEDLETYLRHPSYFPEGIQLAVTGDGEVAAVTELWLDLTDPQTLHTGLTGTARAHRRKGLASALKVHSLNMAKGRGVQKIVTHNASTNAPMLAINQKLGFVPEPASIQMRWGRIEEEYEHSDS